ncbi:hypothetical protein, partial [Pectobacterium aquaticum]|uniref:hypothetical protein n=1 Tax=Pectobacterium aquaticum TaxID=2204145 RepID=UPI001D0237A8
RTPKPRYALFHHGTLPPHRDFTACNRHIIAAATAAAITRFVVEPGLSRREPFRSLPVGR